MSTRLTLLTGFVCLLTCRIGAPAWLPRPASPAAICFSYAAPGRLSAVALRCFCCSLRATHIHAQFTPPSSSASRRRPFLRRSYLPPAHHGVATPSSLYPLTTQSTFATTSASRRLPHPDVSECRGCSKSEAYANGQGSTPAVHCHFLPRPGSPLNPHSFATVFFHPYAWNPLGTTHDPHTSAVASHNHQYFRIPTIVSFRRSPRRRPLIITPDGIGIP